MMMMMTSVLVCLSDPDLMGPREHILTKTEDKIVHTFFISKYFKTYLKFILLALNLNL